MMRRLLCAFGLHSWRYLTNSPQDGRAMRRGCAYCGRRQQWDASAARERGEIRWVPSDER